MIKYLIVFKNWEKKIIKWVNNKTLFIKENKKSIKNIIPYN